MNAFGTATVALLASIAANVFASVSYANGTCRDLEDASRPHGMTVLSCQTDVALAADAGPAEWVLFHVQEWLARANRDYQTRVARRLTAPKPADATSPTKLSADTGEKPVVLGSIEPEIATSSAPPHVPTIEPHSLTASAGPETGPVLADTAPLAAVRPPSATQATDLVAEAEATASEALATAVDALDAQAARTPETPSAAVTKLAENRTATIDRERAESTSEAQQARKARSRTASAPRPTSRRASLRRSVKSARSHRSKSWGQRSSGRRYAKARKRRVLAYRTASWSRGWRGLRRATMYKARRCRFLRRRPYRR